MDTLSLITDLRHELHRHPELSLEEKWTKHYLLNFVKENTSLEVTDCGRWFYALKRADVDGTKEISAGSEMAEKASLKKSSTAKLSPGKTLSAGTSSEIRPPEKPRSGSVLPENPSPGKTIAFRADFDALPIEETIVLPWGSERAGVSHKCGHDGHSAALAGLALELDKRKVPGDVYLIFQHAEEIGAGARECAELIEQKHIEEIYAFHNLNGYPENTAVYRRGLTQPASEGLTVRFLGKTSHASYPEQGANPSFAVADLICFIRHYLKAANELEEPLGRREPQKAEKPHKAMILCTVVNIQAGTKDFGVSAGRGEVSLTLRAEEEDDMRKMDTAIRRKAEELAKKDHLQTDFQVSDYFPETRNDDRCLDRVIKAAGQCGIPTMEMPELWRASEDFGWYQKKCPGAIFYIGDGENYPALHTVGYDFNDHILPTALQIFLRLACGDSY